MQSHKSHRHHADASARRAQHKLNFTDLLVPANCLFEKLVSMVISDNQCFNLIKFYHAIDIGK
jgi:hypothetical protein